MVMNMRPTRRMRVFRTLHIKTACGARLFGLPSSAFPQFIFYLYLRFCFYFSFVVVLVVVISYACSQGEIIELIYRWKRLRN